MKPKKNLIKSMGDEAIARTQNKMKKIGMAPPYCIMKIMCVEAVESLFYKRMIQSGWTLFLKANARASLNVSWIVLMRRFTASRTVMSVLLKQAHLSTNLMRWFAQEPMVILSSTTCTLFANVLLPQKN